MSRPNKKLTTFIFPAITLGVIGLAIVVNALNTDRSQSTITRASKPTNQTSWDFQGTIGDWQPAGVTVLPNQDPQRLVFQTQPGKNTGFIVSPRLAIDIQDSIPSLTLQAHGQALVDGQFVNAKKPADLEISFITNQNKTWDSLKSVMVPLSLSDQDQVIHVNLAQAEYLPQPEEQLTFLRISPQRGTGQNYDSIEMAINKLEFEID